MDTEALAALSRLLDGALELPPAARASWLDGLGSEHDALRSRLRRLLSEHESAETGAGPFATVPKDSGIADDCVADIDDAAVTPGWQVGPYRLVRRIGAGGMGVVWLAERPDGLITRPVALKLPRGTWRRAALAERMAREREILSKLEHPHIGRLYDAGLTSSGQPYLALEYVDGRPIDAYASAQELGVRARLALFLQVLDAVAHAHARLIVHRDLKPANILVTNDGQAKLLDFGIAKLLRDGAAADTQLTEASGRPLTPEYASPEQVAGDLLTTASDVYSLGVVLHELLAGVRPERARPPQHPRSESRSAARAEARPSDLVTDRALRTELRGDLDTILLKALKAEPPDRYQTVSALADDVQRFLDGRPVLARPDSAWYRLSKFAYRNPALVATATAAVLAVLIGTAMALWQARAARDAQHRAEEVKEFIAAVFRGANPYVTQGEKLTALDLLKQARARIGRIESTRSDLRVELLTLVGESLADIAEVDQAEAVLREAVEESSRVLGPAHPLTLHARTVFALTRRYVGDRTTAGSELDALLPALRAPTAAATDLASALESRATWAMEHGRWGEAESASREMIAVTQARLGPRHTLTLSAQWSLVQSYLLGRKVNEAAALADQVFPLLLDEHRDEPRSPELIEARELYGRVLTGVGRLTEGIAQQSQALNDAVSVFGSASIVVAYYTANLASRQLEIRDLTRALETADKAIDLTGRAPGPTSGVHAFAHHTRGRILLAARNGREAVAQMSLALAKLAGASEREKKELGGARARRALGMVYDGQLALARTELASVESTDLPPTLAATVHRLTGDLVGALDAARQAVDAVTPGPQAARDRSMALCELGLSLVELGRRDEAVRALTEALTLSRTLDRHPAPEHADILIGLGRATLEQGLPSDALPLLVEADAFWRDFAPDTRWAGEAALWLGRTYLALGREPDAAAALDRAQTLLARSPMPSDAKLVALARRKA